MPRLLKQTLKIAAETALISTVGSLVWIAMGRSTVLTSSDGTWQTTSFTENFWHFFFSIVPLYLLYLFVRWLIGYIAKKTAKTVDHAFQDVGTYTNVRDRVVKVFADGDAMPTFVPPTEPAPPEPATPDQANPDPRSCQSCGVLPGNFHLPACQRNAS